MSTKQTFEIIDGVYVGPEHWESDLDLREYMDILYSLGNLKTVGGWLFLNDCKGLTTLGNIKTVGGWLFLNDCKGLTTLGNLKTVGGYLELTGCTSLTALENLETVGEYLSLRRCSGLTTLGNLEKVGRSLTLIGCMNITSLGNLEIVGDVVDLSKSTSIPLKEVQEKIKYYSAMQAHEALNAIHTPEVQEIPIYRSILMGVLQKE